MSDFGITTTREENPVDTRWRASQHGQFTAQPGTLDVSKFVDGTHYNIGARKDNVIPSGVAVVYNAGTSMYEPWVAEPTYPTAEHPVVDGYINDNQGVEVKRADGSTAAKAAFARLLHGFVDAAFLPVAAQATDLPAAESSVQITFI